MKTLKRRKVTGKKFCLVWKELNKVQFMENEAFELALTKPWYDFEVGTTVNEIWQTFEEEFPTLNMSEAMYMTQAEINFEYNHLVFK